MRCSRQACAIIRAGLSKLVRSSLCWLPMALCASFPSQPATDCGHGVTRSRAASLNLTGYLRRSREPWSKPSHEREPPMMQLGLVISRSPSGVQSKFQSGTSRKLTRTNSPPLLAANISVFPCPPLPQAGACHPFGYRVLTIFTRHRFWGGTKNIVRQSPECLSWPLTARSTVRNRANASIFPAARASRSICVWSRLIRGQLRNRFHRSYRHVARACLSSGRV